MHEFSCKHPNHYFHYKLNVIFSDKLSKIYDKFSIFFVESNIFKSVMKLNHLCDILRNLEQNDYDIFYHLHDLYFLCFQPIGLPSLTVT